MNDDVSYVKRSTVSLVAQSAMCIAVLVIAVWFGRTLKRPTSNQPRKVSTLPAVEHRVIIDEVSKSPHARTIPLYTTYCTKCHGPDGHGDPDALLRLTPPPRDFAGNNWRFAKSDSEITRVIQDGIPGTAMPSMKHLFSQKQLRGLTDYVLRLSDQSPAPEPTVPEHLRGLAEHGFTVFPNPSPGPKLKLLATDDTDVELVEFSGNVVLINFWGTMCSHCLREMPALAELERRYADRGLVVLSVCADSDDPDEISETAARFVPGHPVFRDATGLSLQKYSVNALPTFVILDREQRIVARRSGAMDWSNEELSRAIAILVDDINIPEPVSPDDERLK